MMTLVSHFNLLFYNIFTTKLRRTQFYEFLGLRFEIKFYLYHMDC